MIIVCTKISVFLQKIEKHFNFVNIYEQKEANINDKRQTTKKKKNTDLH
jgi:hypothetical protein